MAELGLQVSLSEKIKLGKTYSKARPIVPSVFSKEKSNFMDYLSSKNSFIQKEQHQRAHSQPKMGESLVEDPNRKRLIYAVRTRKGFSPNSLEKPNQDSYAVKINFLDRDNYHFFCVCDGHGVNGHLVSQFVCKDLEHQLQKKILAYEGSRQATGGNLESYALEEVIFNAVDSCVKALLKEPIDLMFSGTTCNFCVIKDDLLYVTNIGDSRSILGYTENGKTLSKALSYDHKPEFESEKQRILKNNGRIAKILAHNGTYVGPQRVWLKDEDLPGLAMTRSIGDLVAESVGVTWKPGSRS